MEDKKIIIIDGCIICRTCEFTDPTTFRVRENELTAEVLNESISAERWPKIKEAIKLCPVKVIKLKSS